MRIARVFPTKTSMSPTDQDAHFDVPDLFTPQYDEVHISVTFTWDIPKAGRLADAWKNKGVVRIGGCVYGRSDGDFCNRVYVGGKYLRKGVTITTRGCPNNCTFCIMPKREGKMRELPIVEGNILQDNNILAASKGHIRSVFQMLKQQRQVSFRGGLESARVDDEFVEQLRGIRLQDVWLAYDHPNAEKPLIKAVDKLKVFGRNKLRCYVLIGYDNDTIEKAEIRLRRAWEIGVLPFAMLYRDEQGKVRSKEWKQFQRKWSRPAIFRKLCQSNKKG